MKSIRDFKPEEKKKSEIDETAHELYEKYSGLSEDQLMTELMRAVASGRRDGTFSESQLDEFVGFVSPSLDDDARKKLENLVKTIKNN